MATITNTRPFRIDALQADLDDLQQRLARTRLPRPAPGDDWSYGTPNHYLADMVERWRSFNWRAVEERINAFPGYLTEIDGQTVHYLHVPSPEVSAVPLLLVPAYPGSLVDFLDMIGPLSDPVAHGGAAEDAFHVVVASLPGSGHSVPVADGGWTMARVARTFDALMRDLGYDSYGAHGSDAGAMVGRELGLLEPAGYLGSHVLQAFSFPSGDPAEFANLSESDHAAMAFLQWFQSVGGYNAINASRPQTVGVGISDSPVGLLAWNELFNSFGNGTSLLTEDQILAEVTMEWLTNTGATWGRYHYEEAHAGAEPRVNSSRMGVAIFADDFTSIRTFADRDNSNIVHWTEHPRGGHYASLEVPDVVVGDVRDFFRPVR